MEKELIKKRFAKSLPTYKESAVVQEIMAENLVNMLPENDYDNILELGSGCGLLTKKIADNIRFKKYYAVDMVRECEKYIRKISTDIDFIQADIEDFIPSETVDLILSNASLQWLDDLENFIQKMKNHLNKNGIFGFTVFGKDNYKELKTILKSNLKYYSIDEVEKICSGYEVLNISEDKNILDFETPKDVLYHIRNTGVNALSQTHWTKRDLKQFIEDYNRVCDNKITLTYHPIYVVLRKN
ncbi:MAG: malonyl-ACP O-methyltransferase BioC [Cyanobacteria bacterium RUI128]|nr:malonyl-ACP O-methyltransferase BioC [Cyanobacteria bacterium RUI128]